ncbi:efflux RND transporter periplasmic adaptor subunit [Alcaligenes aquatilis]|uniref:Efflux RND transporter periplasmic adaptor subunit n=2 Tax=Alcaligenes TaxID=507 RepID=A0A3G2HY92_9BURK|nr:MULTISPECIES: efflux RND transporter periplasmic adaptor subunit [Alcaligenes]ASR90845.1 efflux transporter periplasmic adaptor subunit [Alcaligenes faecalis]AYN22122.1 efflux RND transporter periplasmic adaptor subunit [Alcaligenes aquatilis]UQN35593.1 efflux RND transporter periplasmic adaptor subunit [Alcaligenes aquatilis]UYY86820.1 efflux RND transporter periplasmic adaptor subunit [Alcaligenes sp. SMD-FA]
MSELNTGKGRRSRSFYVWVLVGLLLTAGLVYYALSSPSDTPTPMRGPRGMMGATKVPVQVATVKTGLIDQTVNAIATVKPLQTVAVRGEVDGVLERIHFKDGQRVKAGDLLAEIDPRTYQVQLDQARGQLAQSQAQLKGAQQELARHRVLFQQNSIARQALETKETAVQQLQAQIKSNQAEVARAQVQLDRTRITAPLDGRLGLRKLDQGNLVSAGNTDGIVVITQVDPIGVEFSLPQNQLSSLLEAMKQSESPLRVSLIDSKAQLLSDKGRLQALDNQIDINTGTLRVKAEFDNDNETLFANQFVNARVFLGQEQGLLIPSHAIQRGSVGTYVYTLDDEDKVHIQVVELGTATLESTLIKTGLKEGDRVVVEGTDRLREGSEVDVMQQDGQAKEKPAPTDAGAQAEQDTRSGEGRRPRPASE